MVENDQVMYESGAIKTLKFLANDKIRFENIWFIHALRVTIPYSTQAGTPSL